MSTFSENLKMLRKQENLTIVELSVRIGYSKSIISYWEKGIKEPTLSALIKIAAYFCISMDELTGTSDEIKDASRLTQEEWQLVEDYRGLGRPLKNMLQGIITTLQNNTAQEKRKGGKHD